MMFSHLVSKYLVIYINRFLNLFISQPTPRSPIHHPIASPKYFLRFPNSIFGIRVAFSSNFFFFNVLNYFLKLFRLVNNIFDNIL